MGAAARFRVQARVGSQWEHVSWCRTWKRVLEVVGKPNRDPEPEWVTAGETPEVRLHMRTDFEFRVVENLTSTAPDPDVNTRPIRTSASVVASRRARRDPLT